MPGILGLTDKSIFLSNGMTTLRLEDFISWEFQVINSLPKRISSMNYNLIYFQHMLSHKETPLTPHWVLIGSVNGVADLVSNKQI